MSQRHRSETQRPQTAPASHRTSLLDLGPLHQALPRATLVQQRNRNLISSAPRQQTSGKPDTRSLPVIPRTPKRVSTAEGGKVASISKRPSTSEGSRIVSAPPRWERPTTAESKKLFSTPGKVPRRPADPQTLARKKDSADALRSIEWSGTPGVARLPPDLLCQCFISIESLYYLVNCASVCRAWRDAMLSDMVWKTIYLKWWHSLLMEESLHVQKYNETSLASLDTRTPPEGHNSWRSAFIARFQEGKKELLVREKGRAMSAGHLHVRQMTDRYGKRAFDCVQGDNMQKLAEYLGLTFNICLNRGRQIKIQGRGKIDIFQNSCVLRYPHELFGNLDLAALKSVEVTATSDKLLRVCPVIGLVSVHNFDNRLPVATWEMVSTTSRSPGPLRLLQYHITSGASVIVGTLAEERNFMDGINGEEQVLLLVVSLHLNDLLWKLMELGEGPSSRISRKVVPDELDPHFGLHSWHVSVQLHTFGRNIWTRNFIQVFWNPLESVPGEKAVLSLVSQHEVFPGILKLPWKSEAFSGSLMGVYLLDVTLWDGGGEIAWESSSAIRIDPAPLAVVEYGIEFDGERVHSHLLDNEHGVSMAISMSIPLHTHWQTPDNKPIIAITNMEVGLTRKFLQGWCGAANI